MRFTQDGMLVKSTDVPLAETDAPLTIFAVDDQFVPSVENIVLPAVVGDNDAPVPPKLLDRMPAVLAPCAKIDRSRAFAISSSYS
jgi:hypothetical protein